MTPNTSNNGARVTSQSYQHEIARGRVPGASNFGGFGRLEAAGAVTKNIVWPNGAFIFPALTGEDVSFKSTSDEDGAGAGTGILTVEAHYLDVDLIPRIAIITLNGTTEVSGQLTGCRFLQELHVLTAGSTLAAVGVITAYKHGAPTTVYNLIAALGESSESTLRMVPSGKVAYFAGFIVSSISGTAAARVDIQPVATEIEAHQYTDPYIFVPFTGIGVQDGGVSPSNLPVYKSFREGTVVGIRATSDKGATISATWFGWLEPAATAPEGGH